MPTRFPDGHEELVRNIQFVGLNVAAFKDILAVSKEPNSLTVQWRPSAKLGMIGGIDVEESFTPVTRVVPSLLFEDASMRRIRGVATTPPVSSHPYFDK